MSDRATPFVGAARVPWLRPLAQVLRVLALGIGATSTTASGWTVPDIAVAATLVAFISWRAAPAELSPVRLRVLLQNCSKTAPMTSDPGRSRRQ